eukprot:gene4681-5017_t
MNCDRIWWTNEEYKERLNQRIASNDWFVCILNENSPGKVIKVIFAGYKVELPDGVSCNVHPSKTRDILQDEYEELKVLYFQRLREKEEEAKRREDERLAKLELQRQCQHTNVREEDVVKAAGCDITDTFCIDCDKRLRRSWSTAYDRDPNDHISDWDWWCRYYQSRYNSQPRRSDYEVVNTIEW